VSARVAAVPRGHEGFVATELVAGIALLLVPVACVVLTLPTWSERTTTARAIARQVARLVAASGVCDTDAAAGLTAVMSRNLGLEDGDAMVVLDCRSGVPLAPGTELEAAVTVRMPGVALPAVGTVGEWHWTTAHREPVDRYASDP
jgi:hypothetical protein